MWIIVPIALAGDAAGTALSIRRGMGLATGNGYPQSATETTLAVDEEADMSPEPEFGPELRRRRMNAGWSLGKFAKELPCSKGYLSRVEQGKQLPSTVLARRCDVVLGAGGELGRLIRPRPPAPSTITDGGADGDDGVWVIELRRDGGNMFDPMGRRQALRLGVASLVSGVRAIASPASSGHTASDYRALFDLTRRIGQTSSPSLVLPMVIAQAHALRCLLPAAGPKERTELALLAARNAEYAGWMAQECGDVDGALWWTRKSVAIASEVGDRDLEAYSLVRYALVAMYRGDATSTIDLAQGAQADSRTPPRIRGLAAQREGQGHALAGDHTMCMRALDRAGELLDDDAQEQGAGPVIGTSFVDDPVAVVRGWCLHDLGRPAEAAEVLDREVARIPRGARRAWARFTARQALAHATAGHVDRACDLARDLADGLFEIDSETVRSDVRNLAGVLRRWHNDPAVRSVDPILTEALRRPA